MDSARTIKILTESGAITAALKAEHYAIEDALQTLDGAIIARASGGQLTQIMDIVVDFCVAHFAHEEREFSAHNYQATEAHTRAHKKLLEKFQSARTAIVEGKIEGLLDAADLLNAFHDHVSRFDRAAHTHVLESQIARGAGDVAHQRCVLDQLSRTTSAF